MKLLLLIVCSLVTPTIYSQTVNPIGVSQTFRQYAEVTKSNPTYSGPNPYMTSFNPKEDTEGSPYLLKNWSKGMVVLKEMTLNEPGSSLNFDKISKQLLLRVGDDKVMQINMTDIVEFTLQDSVDNYHFVRAGENPNLFVIEIYKDSLYSLYKTIDTKFYRADFVNKGLYQTGYKYDRYVDKYNYFIKSNKGELFTLENASKKDLKKIAELLPPVKTYIKEHDSTTYNE